MCSSDLDWLILDNNGEAEAMLKISHFAYTLEEGRQREEFVAFSQPKKLSCSNYCPASLYKSLASPMMCDVTAMATVFQYSLEWLFLSSVLH